MNIQTGKIKCCSFTSPLNLSNSLSVRGIIPAPNLGYTLTHEHFQLDFHHFYSCPPAHLEPLLAPPSIKLETVGFLRQYPYSSKYNLNFFDGDTRQAIEADLKYFTQFGGISIAENTSHGLKRDLAFMKRVSESTGVNVIAGTGHYVGLVQDPSTLAMTTEAMCELYRKDLAEGEDGIKCGFIGEVGSGWPVSDFERRAICAAAEVSAEFKCGVSIHPGREREAPFELVRIFLEAGGRKEKCVMSHVDRTLFNMEDILEFASLGTFVQMDLFGTECSYYQLNETTDMISDAERINKIRALIADGKVEQLLMSHDIHTKHRLIPFGGHGFGHILNNILPKMKLRGVTAEEIQTITVDNPRRWLEAPFL